MAIVEFLPMDVHGSMVDFARKKIIYGDFVMALVLDNEVAAAAFERLLQHLQQHPEAQNIDLMILADFCRNCLAKWYVEAAQGRGKAIGYEQARELVYGMPYDEWKSQFQQEATPEKLMAYQHKLGAK